jgi:IS5 family transposase
MKRQTPAMAADQGFERHRDPEMHQTRKGKQWDFGIKLHSGVATPATTHDKHPLPDLLHGQERRVYGDSAYASQKALMQSKAPKAKDLTNERIRRENQPFRNLCLLSFPSSVPYGQLTSTLAASLDT